MRVMDESCGTTPRNSLLNWDDLLNLCLCSPYPYAATNTRLSGIAIFLHTPELKVDNSTSA